MSVGFRKRQSTLHTWSGLVVGWILFLIFVMGSVSYWKDELNRWTRPELAKIEDRDTVVRGAVVYLAGRAGDADSWFIPVPGERAAGAQLFWQPRLKDGEVRRRGRRADTQALIGADGQPAAARATRGGEFFYRLHFDLHYVPVIWARWFVSICTMFMLVAIVSGVLTHKKIFKDFFTLRRARGQRSWLDGHNALAVLSLPFHLMITYTGLITLMTMSMPWAAIANYSDTGAMFDRLFPHGAEVERSGRPAPLVDLVPLIRDAEQRWGGGPAGTVRVSFPNDAAARVTITRSAEASLNARGPSVDYDGVSGRLLWQSPAPGAAVVTAGAMLGLHMARFTSTVPRWLYFLSGIAGTLMVASGLVLWTVKRRERLPDPARPHFGFRLVERLNIGIVAGLPLAMAGFLWANRLLPLDLVERAEWEVHGFFIVLAAALVFAWLRTPRHAWTALLGGTGVALLLLPLHDALAGTHGLPQALRAGDGAMAAVEAALLGFGGTFLLIARRVHRYRPKVLKRRARDRQPAVAAAPAGLIEEPAE